ncbi:MAG: sigma-70 family RNA polymerase sigma factor [Oscillospiraceae bacterium]|nr:sigma-70 family RNA polymerase sigma factor [Oscillospiraceae bacterium]
MTDEEIIRLFGERSERAIAEAQRRYGGLCRRVAVNVLGSAEDAEECLNDALYAVWNAIPPECPQSLCAFIARITRNHALTRLKARRRQKRGGGEPEVLLSELGECVPTEDFADKLIDGQHLGELISGFLNAQSEVNAAVFTERYFHCRPIAEIARESGFSQSKVTSILHRMREKLRRELAEKGEFI